MSNIPDFFKEKLKRQYNIEIIEEIIKGLNEKKQITLRVNLLKSNKNEIIEIFKKNNIKYQEIIWYNDAFIINNTEENIIRNLDIYKEGKIYLQSLSAMIPVLVLNPKNGENILDMCAAPGGKTTQIASITRNQAYVTAVERNKIRSEKLKYNIQKQGATSVNIMVEDSRYLSEFLKFDKIILDAPCSGSGTENIFKKNFTEELITKSCIIQEKLIEKALKILKTNGELIYSTCSILKDENENIIENVLNKNPNCKLINFELSNDIKCLTSKFKEVKTIQPSKSFEGFFIAKIKKV